MTDTATDLDALGAQLEALANEPRPDNVDPIVWGLRRRRILAKLSQRDIATAIGSYQSAVSDWETGRGITLTSLRRYAEAVGCDITLAAPLQNEPDS